MDPVVIYVLVLAGIGLLAMLIRRMVVVPKRRCFMCDTPVPVTERRCRSCGYYFEAVNQEERKRAVLAPTRGAGVTRSSASPRSEARSGRAPERGPWR